MCDSAIFHTFAADNSVKFDVFFNPILLWTHGDTALFWNCLIALLTLQLIESPFLLRPKPCTRECEISYRGFVSGIQKPFSGEAVGVLKLVFFCPQNKKAFQTALQCWAAQKWMPWSPLQTKSTSLSFPEMTSKVRKSTAWQWASH